MIGGSVKACSKPPTIPHGTVHFSGLMKGDTTIYICDQSYQATKNKIQICGRDGEWSGDVPKCILG